MQMQNITQYSGAAFGFNLFVCFNQQQKNLHNACITKDSICCSAGTLCLTSGSRVDGVRDWETAKVRPMKLPGRTLTIDTASSGAATLTDSSRKSMLFPILSVRLRTLHLTKEKTG